MKNKTTKKHRKLHLFLKSLAVLFSVVILLAGSLLFLILHDWSDPYQEYETDNRYITEYGKTFVSAHRSGAGIFPENTMMAFEGCFNSDLFKTDVYEFDLHITADDELILLHDDTLDRTTNAVEHFGTEGIRPENYTYEELRQLNFGENFRNDEGEMPYKGLRGDDIPDSLRASSLKDVLTYLESNGHFDYIIEIKNDGELGRKSADKLYSTLKDMDLIDNVVVGTFNEDVTAYIDTEYPDMPRSASVNEVIMMYAHSLLGINIKSISYKFDALQIPMDKYILDLSTTRLVNFAHKNNIAVQYWTINDVDDIELLKSIGADCIMSDVPDVAYDILNA